MANQDHPLADLIADHLNGHLDAEQSALVDAALRDDASFRELVEQEAILRAHIQSSVPAVNRPPDQLAFERALQEARSRRPRSVWLTGGAAIAATAIVAVGIGVFDRSSSEGEYETLTDETATFGDRTLRIAVDGNADIASLVSKYRLEIVTDFPELGAAVVRMPESAEADLIIRALRDEPGVRFVEYE
ncbi:MAG: hypothetical protein AAFN07_08715 [Pseudomonadota bacterium]